LAITEEKRMKSVFVRAVPAALAMVIGAALAAPLPQLNIDKTQTTVSGISSGGYMAVQLHVAYSATFRKGAGVVAGGPYNCAQASVLNAIGRCLGRAPIPVADLVAITGDWARNGLIDATANLLSSKVYLFSGAKDSAVPASTSVDLQTYYQNYLPTANIVLKKDIEAEHAMVTDDYGAPCLIKASPFINNCNFDLAGAMFQHLYGSLAARTRGVLDGALIEFDQTPFVTGHGMAATGWAYVPHACAMGASGVPCRLHVALHGCKQNATDVGQEFVRNAGYNRWADANNIVVLYPQTGKGATNSCWDWWGYDDADHAKKTAPQMMAIIAMIEQLSRGTPAPVRR
jgi:poly(3-hydroxybutyrate) depolymerase